nr:hypothetical protein [Asanoa iriomotensis]
MVVLGATDGLHHHVGVVDVEVAESVQDDGVEPVGVDARRGAAVGAVAVTGPAGVVAVGAATAMGDGAEVCAPAQRAADLAGEVVLRGGAGCGGGVFAALDEQALGQVERLAVDDAGVGVLDFDVAEQNGTYIYGVAEDVGDRLEAVEGSAASPHAAFVDLFGHHAAADAVLGVDAEDLLDGRHLRFDRHEVLRVGVGEVALRCDAECPLAFAGFAFHAVDDPVDDHLAFELGEDTEHLHEHPPGGSGGVERLGRGAEDHCGVVELFEQGAEITDAAGEPVNSVHEQHVIQPSAGGHERSIEVRAVDLGAGGVVGVFLHERPAVLGLDIGLQLRGLSFDGEGLIFLVGGAPGVDSDPDGAGGQRWGGPSRTSASWHDGSFASGGVYLRRRRRCGVVVRAGAKTAMGCQPRDSATARTRSACSCIDSSLVSPASATRM